MKKVMVVFGTRPEAIKMCPLIKEFEKRKSFKTVVCVTGQHEQMLEQVLDVFRVKPDYNLHIMKEKQNLFDITMNSMEKIRPILEKERPDMVLVHGDTSSAFAVAMACFFMRIPVGHVEAGLRTYNRFSPYPEEFNRQAIDTIAEYYFAPTNYARENLLREGKKESEVYVTGNTVIDALQYTVQEDYWNEHLEWANGTRLVLVTAHRRENIGENMYQMFRAIKRVSDEYPDIRVLYPIHMNPAVRKIADEIFEGCSNIRLIEPLDVLDFHNFMKKSYLILTDSGGIQEEAPSLGKPVLVMRDTTERQEGVESGTLRLVGTKEESIYQNFKQLLEDHAAYRRMSEAVNPYGDGKASERIADIIEEKIISCHNKLSE